MPLSCFWERNVDVCTRHLVLSGEWIISTNHIIKGEKNAVFRVVCEMTVCSVSKYPPNYLSLIRQSRQTVRLRRLSWALLHIQESLERLANLTICSSRNTHHSVYHLTTNYINGCLQSLEAASHGDVKDKLSVQALLFLQGSKCKQWRAVGKHYRLYRYYFCHWLTLMALSYMRLSVCMCVLNTMALRVIYGGRGI